MQRWYLVYTKPNNEEFVASKLIECGFHVLSPMFEERRLCRGKIQNRLAPLFPCYIFVKFNPYEHYNFVKYTRGIRKVIGTGNRPTVVSERIIESLQKRMVDGVISVKASGFKHNEEVSISEGQLQGLNAIFKKNLNGSERAIILIKAVNAQIIIDSTYLKKVAN